MPERKIVLAKYQDEYDDVVKLLGEGWIMDNRIYKGSPMRLEASIVYHLIKFAEEELAAMAKKKELEPQILSMKKVSYEEVDELIKQGYTVKDSYAKDVIMQKIGAPIIEETTETEIVDTKIVIMKGTGVKERDE